MIFALLPVKAPENAKQRLKDFLTPEQREALARAMYEEVLATLLTVEGLDRVVVVTSDAIAARLARAANAADSESPTRICASSERIGAGPRTCAASVPAGPGSAGPAGS